MYFSNKNTHRRTRVEGTIDLFSAIIDVTLAGPLIRTDTVLVIAAFFIPRFLYCRRNFVIRTCVITIVSCADVVFVDYEFGEHIF